MDNKYILTRWAIDRVRQLVRGKEKNILNPSQRKPPIQVLEEILQSKISIRKPTTNLQKKEIKESKASPSE